LIEDRTVDDPKGEARKNRILYEERRIPNLAQEGKRRGGFTQQFHSAM
jgi:hypothetical protein